MKKNDLTIVFGYSSNEERYSYKAFHLLKECGFEAIGLNPRVDSLENMPKKFHTLTMYVNPEITKKFLVALSLLDFKRIIFNPGTEDEELINHFKNKGCDVEIACTLVLLKTGQYAEEPTL